MSELGKHIKASIAVTAMTLGAFGINEYRLSNEDERIQQQIDNIDTCQQALSHLCLDEAGVVIEPTSENLLIADNVITVDPVYVNDLLEQAKPVKLDKTEQRSAALAVSAILSIATVGLAVKGWEHRRRPKIAYRAFRDFTSKKDSQTRPPVLS